MNTIADLIEWAESRGAPRGCDPRRDAAKDARRDHILCAVDRVIRKVPVAECMVRYRLNSRSSVYNFVRYASEYDDPASDLIREALASRAAALAYKRLARPPLRVARPPA